ncbi:MAG TPA: hypothetical protein VGS97_14030 [Actinocrinis sp.]|nr:hypothetical protein [Actinocrinis sp.]HEV2345212.1 hypothetical protein [Actinocrinis sp.]
MKALIGSLGFAYVAHSPGLSAVLLPVLGAVVAAEAAFIVRSLLRKKVRP